MVSQVKRRGVQESKNIDYARHQHNSSLLVERQGDVSRNPNQMFFLVDSFNFTFVDDERSDIYAYRRLFQSQNDKVCIDNKTCNT